MYVFKWLILNKTSSLGSNTGNHLEVSVLAKIENSWLIGFYGISTLVGFLTRNPFLYKKSVLFQTIHFSMSTKFKY